MDPGYSSWYVVEVPCHKKDAQYHSMSNKIATEFVKDEYQQKRSPHDKKTVHRTESRPLVRLSSSLPRPREATCCYIRFFRQEKRAIGFHWGYPNTKRTQRLLFRPEVDHISTVMLLGRWRYRKNVHVVPAHEKFNRAHSFYETNQSQNFSFKLVPPWNKWKHVNSVINEEILTPVSVTALPLVANASYNQWQHFDRLLTPKHGYNGRLHVHWHIPKPLWHSSLPCFDMYNAVFLSWQL